jgi:hypothetical protein
LTLKIHFFNFDRLFVSQMAANAWNRKQLT